MYLTHGGCGSSGMEHRLPLPHRWNLSRKKSSRGLSALFHPVPGFANLQHLYASWSNFIRSPDSPVVHTSHIQLKHRGHHSNKRVIQVPLNANFPGISPTEVPTLRCRGVSLWYLILPRAFVSQNRSVQARGEKLRKVDGLVPG